MAELLSGLVVAVDEHPVGSQTVADAIAGDTVLTLDDAINFDPTGGQATIAGAVVDYVEANDDESTITLATPLAASLASESDVWVYPDRVNRTALVLVDGESDPIPATVPWDKHDALPVGVRDENGREQVLLTPEGQWSWSVFDLVNQPLVRDGAAIWNPHAIRDAQSATIPDNSWTTLASYVEVRNSGITLTADGWTIVYPGFYQVTARLSFSNSSTTNRRGVRVLVNGLEESATIRSADAGRTYMLTIADVDVVEGDVITVQAWQNSGANLAVANSSGTGRDRITVARMSI